MSQTFTVNGREMTLEQAQAYYAAQKAPEASVSEVKEKDEVTPPIEVKAPEKSKKDLQKECDAKGIKYHPALGLAKLASLLQGETKEV